MAKKKPEILKAYYRGMRGGIAISAIIIMLVLILK